MSLISVQELGTAEETLFSNMARDYLSRAFGSESRYINSVLHAAGDGGLYAGMDADEYAAYLHSTFLNRITILRGCIEQLQTEIELRVSAPVVTPESVSANAPKPIGRKVFVVHGHNHGVKETVARFLDKLDLDPVILHEQANLNRTLIEKFSAYADVQFAVVLLTADDEGRAHGDDALKPRARQNVIFELGYFIGALGRDKVCALYEHGVEIPSDYQGVAFVEYKGDQWRPELFRELHAVGFEIDANRLFTKDT